MPDELVMKKKHPILKALLICSGLGVVVFFSFLITPMLKEDGSLFGGLNPSRAVKKADQSMQFQKSWCMKEFRLNPDRAFSDKEWKSPNSIQRCTYDNAYITYRVYHETYIQSWVEIVSFLDAQGSFIAECAYNGGIGARIEELSSTKGCEKFVKHVQCENVDLCSSP